MNEFLRDIRFGARLMLKSPAVTAVAVLALALGIGANTTIFSVVNAVLIRSLPFPEPDRLVVLWGAHPDIGREPASLPDFNDWREQNESFASMAAAAQTGAALTGEGEAERITAARVSANFLSVLGANPIHGRQFLEEEDKTGADRVAILSYGLWQRRFAGDPGAVGRTVSLNGELFTIVGVAPERLKLPEGVEVYLPIARDPASTGRRSNSYLAIGRLRPGVTIEQAGADMRGIAGRLAEVYPDSNAGWTVELVPLHEQLVGEVRPALLILLGAVAFVLLIACANVANLLLARASAREREIAIRVAMGAGRARVFRQLLTESLLLAVLAGSLGVFFALWGVDLLVALSPSGVHGLDLVGLDGGVLGFSLLVTVATGLLFGVAPSMYGSNLAPGEILKEGGRAAGGARQSRLRNLLVIGEVALSLILLIGAGLMIRSFTGLINQDPGFDASNLLTMQVPVSSAKYPEAAQVVDFYETLVERARAAPGVASAALVSPLPLTGGARYWSFTVDGRPAPPPEQVVDANVLIVDRGYVEAMKIPLIAGRGLIDPDSDIGSPGALINQAMVRRYFRDEDPLGKRITFGDPASPNVRWLTIVGIVRDSKQTIIEPDIHPTVYVPAGIHTSSNMALVVRAGGDSSLLASTMRAIVRELDDQIPVYGIRTMDSVVSEGLKERRFALALMVAFALLALILSGVGLYSVMSYSVTRRTHEFGVRMALGASRRDVLRMVIIQGTRLTLIGIAVGLAGAAFLTRLMSGLLVNVSATDPLTFASLPVILIVVATLAAYIPALRATRVDPMAALRYE